MDIENKSERYNKIDLWETKEILYAILESQLVAVSSIHKIVNEIEIAVTKSVPLLKNGGRLIFAGSGTSGRIAAQECSELFPTFSWPKNKALFIIAGGTKALGETIEHAEDLLSQGEAEAKKLNLNSKDIVVCLAASGRTPFTLGVLRSANLSNSLTIAIASSVNSPLLNEAHVKLFSNTGQEVIAGSTRMKAGTAQKVILNMFTTTLMIRLNRTYDSYMVDVVASNDKLTKRATQIVSEISSVNLLTAKEALKVCQGNVKLACVYLKYQNIEKAKEILQEYDGDLRKILNES